VRHSHAHLEIVFFIPEGGIDCYIDIFAGYHDDGFYNQPLALRMSWRVQSCYRPSRSRCAGSPFRHPRRRRRG